MVICVKSRLLPLIISSDESTVDILKLPLKFDFVAFLNVYIYQNNAEIICLCMIP